MFSPKVEPFDWERPQYEQALGRLSASEKRLVQLFMDVFGTLLHKTRLPEYKNDVTWKNFTTLTCRYLMFTNDALNNNLERRKEVGSQILSTLESEPLAEHLGNLELSPEETLAIKQLLASGCYSSDSFQTVFCIAMRDVFVTPQPALPRAAIAGPALAARLGPVPGGREQKEDNEAMEAARARQQAIVDDIERRQRARESAEAQQRLAVARERALEAQREAAEARARVANPAAVAEVQRQAREQAAEERHRAAVAQAEARHRAAIAQAEARQQAGVAQIQAEARQRAAAAQAQAEARQQAAAAQAEAWRQQVEAGRAAANGMAAMQAAAAPQQAAPQAPGLQPQPEQPHGPGVFLARQPRAAQAVLPVPRGGRLAAQQPQVGQAQAAVPRAYFVRQAPPAAAQPAPVQAPPPVLPQQPAAAAQPPLPQARPR